MSKQVRLRSDKREPVDVDKLALAFLMLVRVLHNEQASDECDDRSPSDREAA